LAVIDVLGSSRISQPLACTLFQNFFSDCEASNIFINKKINSETDLYFERNAEIFVCILSFYQGRGLHIPNKFCPGEFQEELQYWGDILRNFKLFAVYINFYFVLFHHVVMTQ
jgi:hypothetical protein